MISRFMPRLHTPLITNFLKFLLNSLAEALIQMRYVALAHSRRRRKRARWSITVRSMQAVVEGKPARARDAMEKHLVEAKATARRRAGALGKKK